MYYNTFSEREQGQSTYRFEATFTSVTLDDIATITILIQKHLNYHLLNTNFEKWAQIDVKIEISDVIEARSLFLLV